MNKYTDMHMQCEHTCIQIVWMHACMYVHTLSVDTHIPIYLLEKCDILSTLVSKFSKINTCDLYYNNPHSFILCTKKFYLFKKKSLGWGNVDW